MSSNPDVDYAGWPVQPLETRFAIVPDARTKTDWNGSADWKGRVFEWNEPIGRSKVGFLYLADLYGKHAVLPRCMDEVSQIEEATVPTHLVKLISPSSPLLGVRALNIAGSKNVALPKGLVFANAGRLICAAGVFRFTHSAFPNLEQLSLRTDAKGTMLDVIGSYRLSMLGVGPCNAKVFSFDQLAAAAPQYVRLHGGDLTSLDGIEALDGLTKLWVHVMSPLTDISAIANCRSLEEVTFSHCQHLGSLEALLKLPKLRKLMLFNCRAKDAPLLERELKPKLESFSSS